MKLCENCHGEGCAVCNDNGVVGEEFTGIGSWHELSDEDRERVRKIMDKIKGG